MRVAEQVLDACMDVGRCMGQKELVEYDRMPSGAGPVLVHAVFADVFGIAPVGAPVDVTVVHRNSGEAVVDGNQVSVHE